MANGELEVEFYEALMFAAEKHRGQRMPGTRLPYLTHVVTVAMEVMIAGMNTPGFDLNLGVSVALLHDTMEDTETSYNEVKDKFGVRIAEGVLALTKFRNIEKPERMKDSIARIKALEREVWAVKLADRISNLEAPAINWNQAKRLRYKEGSENILRELSEGNQFLATRLEQKIIDYQKYVATGEK